VRRIDSVRGAASLGFLSNEPERQLQQAKAGQVLRCNIADRGDDGFSHSDDSQTNLGASCNATSGT